MSKVNVVEVKIARIAYWSIGVRLWFVIQTDTGVRYQRWSMIMDSTDECLLLSKQGDVVSIKYVDESTDLAGTVQKNVITEAEFV